MKIRRKLILSHFFVVFTAGILVAIPVFLNQQKALTKNIYSIADAQLDYAGSQLDLFLDAPLNTIVSAMNFVETSDNKERVPVEKFLKQSTTGKPDYSMFYYASKAPVNKGGFLYSDVSWDPPSDWDQTTRGWFKKAIATKKPVFSDPYVDDYTKAIVVTISQSYYSGNELKGVVGLDLILNSVVELVNSVKLSDGGTSFMIDSTGKYVTNPDTSKVGTANFFDEYGFSEYKTKIEKGEGVFTTGTDGTYFASRKLNDICGWTVVTFGPKKELVRSIYLTVNTIIGMLLIVFILTVLVAFLLSSKIVKPIKEAGESLNEMASGNADLTSRLSVTSHDEVSYLAQGFNSFMEKLHGIISELNNSNTTLATSGSDLKASSEDTINSIGEVIDNISTVSQQILSQNKSVEQTAGAVNQISANIASLENMIEGQAKGVAEASAAVEQMIGNISSVNNSVEKMALSFNDLQNDTRNGTEKQMDVNEKIQLIEQQSQTLQEANTAISSIAEQTNLLAMNAAIEAAHAGEAGKGFSVVADEIRKLSETSSTQSKTIGDQLNLIHQSIEAVVQASNDSSIAFESVSNRIVETDQIVRQIKSAMQEQQEGSKQIIQVLQTMNDSTAEVRVASKEMADGNKTILEEVNQLQNVTTEMKDSMDDMAHGVTKIKETGEALSGISSQMDNVIHNIGDKINQFKV